MTRGPFGVAIPTSREEAIKKSQDPSIVVQALAEWDEAHAGPAEAQPEWQRVRVTSQHLTFELCGVKKWVASNVKC